MSIRFLFALIASSLTASSTFAQLLAFSGASSGLVRWATGLELGPTEMLLMMALPMTAGTK